MVDGSSRISMLWSEVNSWWSCKGQTATLNVAAWRGQLASSYFQIGRQPLSAFLQIPIVTNDVKMLMLAAALFDSSQGIEFIHWYLRNQQCWSCYQKFWRQLWVETRWTLSRHTPDVGCVCPVSNESSNDFPAPFLPTKPVSRGFKLKVMSLNSHSPVSSWNERLLAKIVGIKIPPLRINE